MQKPGCLQDFLKAAGLFWFGLVFKAASAGFASCFLAVSDRFF